MDTVNDVSSDSLSNLPQDIIRIILRLVNHTDTLRLNLMVLEFLSYRKHHPPLKILQFDHFKNAHFIKARIQSEYFLNYLSQGTFNEWANINSDKFRTDVESPAMQIRTIEFKGVQWCTLVSIPTILFGIFLKNFIDVSFSDTTSCFVSIFLTILLTFHSIMTFSRVFYQIYIRAFVKPKVEMNLKRLNLIASRCCFIDCLTMCCINQITLKIIGETLGNVIVDHLYIMDLNVDEEMRNNIVKLARSNYVRIVSIFMSNFTENDLRNLSIDVIENSFRLLIWENKQTSIPDQVFGHPIEFWNDLAHDLEKESCRQSASTLTNLPPDIIRLIVAMIEHPLDELRLFAPIWTSIVVEYLTDRKN
ncbi:hypothetical protein PRIPAC_78476 [Pristionchus pacificus]|uniref:Uncharacterized protein n=1 Tax=Pristionchus pacificus TaxID=54126 RepID=A0A2A6BI03_PRIPA|nr:hypothetical protein PRIPAC_78476 [Pristionchus pacificus]|eukprot:PDM65540.1 hypothetical protein PRIPAC_52482 [Pristionchus pacificus]